MRVRNWHVTKRQLDYSVSSSACHLLVATFSVKACLYSVEVSCLYSVEVSYSPAAVSRELLCHSPGHSKALHQQVPKKNLKIINKQNFLLKQSDMYLPTFIWRGADSKEAD